MHLHRCGVRRGLHDDRILRRQRRPYSERGGSRRCRRRGHAWRAAPPARPAPPSGTQGSPQRAIALRPPRQHRYRHGRPPPVAPARDGDAVHHAAQEGLGIFDHERISLLVRGCFSHCQPDPGDPTTTLTLGGDGSSWLRDREQNGDRPWMAMHGCRFRHLRALRILNGTHAKHRRGVASDLALFESSAAIEASREQRRKAPR